MSTAEQDASLGIVLFVNGTHAEHVAALRFAGYTVEVAATAVEALQRGHSLRPDALIVPLLLPDMEGSHLAQRIGSAAARAHTLAVVILVGTDGADPAGGALTAGATFCSLPCLPADLVALVGRQLAARRPIGGPPPPPSAS